MQTGQNIVRSDLAISWQSVPAVFRSCQRAVRGFLRNARSQPGVRPSFVIVGDPRTQRHPEMALVQGNHEIQALAAHRADQSFTISVRKRRHERSASHKARTLKQLLNIAQRERIAKIPPDGTKDDAGFGLPPLEDRGMGYHFAIVSRHQPATAKVATHRLSRTRVRSMHTASSGRNEPRSKPQLCSR